MESRSKQNRPLETFHSISLRLITEYAWYVSNVNSHNDLHITLLQKKKLAHHQNKRFYDKRSNHQNPITSQFSSLTVHGNSNRRLKINWSRDVLKHDNVIIL